jgi:exopolysaccharide production protein ExoY
MVSYTAVKRIMDCVVAAAALMVMLPLMLVLAAAVSMDGGPVFYRHPRVGRAGREFGCWKFRTMRVNSDKILADYLAHNAPAAQQWRDSRKLTVDPRITWLGKWMRKSSVDELPQLWNVITGDMAIVGPRPVTRDELVNYYHFYADCYSSVRPGITGLWQVSGRSNTSYDHRVNLDMRYVHEHNWRMDTEIVFRTPWAVLAARGSC